MESSRVPGRANSARLLSKAKAAAYCGIGVGKFSTLCPVRPIALGADKRLERYDVVALNEWIDGLSQKGEKYNGDWLELMDADHDESAR